MKHIKILGLALLVIFAGTVFSVPASNAASLPSKCVGVKTQVRAFEKMEKPLSVKYGPVNGKWSWYFATDNSDFYIDLQKTIVDLQVKMFSFDKANIECFTPTQKEYITSSLKIWKDLQSEMKVRPSWLAGFSFVAIVWDSIYSK
ncbi:MAG: hypothetical protein H7227_08180 [Actinobacteria bacterium]|nr:hypothetical protein [Actinomycetota bacterium]